MHASGPGPASPILPVLGPVRPNPASRTSATSAAKATSSTSATAGLTSPSATGEAGPLQAPQGTDPALWAVLTTDEQQFFHEMAALGPLTYGNAPGRSASEAPVGQRVDIRG